jgi:hypothetical protein
MKNLALKEYALRHLLNKVKETRIQPILSTIVPLPVPTKGGRNETKSPVAPHSVDHDIYNENH